MFDTGRVRLEQTGQKAFAGVSSVLSRIAAEQCMKAAGKNAFLAFETAGECYFNDACVAVRELMSRCGQSPFADIGLQIVAIDSPEQPL